MTVQKPRIGITLDAENPGGYSAYPWYALRANYAAAIATHGGTPLCLPHHADCAPDMLASIDALLITGGAFDVDPALYGETHTHQTVVLKSARTAAEHALLQGALNRRMPILGICGGQQLLAVALGATLIQHIPDTIPNALEHEQKNPRHEPGHRITITPGTRLHQITRTTTMHVNSAHHQAVRTPGPTTIVSALADDGVIEAIEHPAHPFCLGVQWHPEFLIDPGDSLILQAFITAATRHE